MKKLSFFVFIPIFVFSLINLAGCAGGSGGDTGGNYQVVVGNKEITNISQIPDLDVSGTDSLDSAISASPSHVGDLSVKAIGDSSVAGCLCVDMSKPITFGVLKLMQMPVCALKAAGSAIVIPTGGIDPESAESYAYYDLGAETDSPIKVRLGNFTIDGEKKLIADICMDMGNGVEKIIETIYKGDTENGLWNVSAKLKVYESEDLTYNYSAANIDLVMANSASFDSVFSVDSISSLDADMSLGGLASDTDLDEETTYAALYSMGFSMETDRTNGVSAVIYSDTADVSASMQCLYDQDEGAAKYGLDQISTGSSVSGTESFTNGESRLVAASNSFEAQLPDLLEMIAYSDFSPTARFEREWNCESPDGFTPLLSEAELTSCEETGVSGVTMLTNGMTAVTTCFELEGMNVGDVDGNDVDGGGDTSPGLPCEEVTNPPDGGGWTESEYCRALFEDAGTVIPEGEPQVLVICTTQVTSVCVLTCLTDDDCLSYGAAFGFTSTCNTDNQCTNEGFPD